MAPSDWTAGKSVANLWLMIGVEGPSFLWGVSSLGREGFRKLVALESGEHAGK